MAPISFIISALVLSGLVSTLQAKNACPCSDPSLCKPPNVPDRPELLGFITSGENWKYYNYTYVTTIAVFAASWDPQVIKLYPTTTFIVNSLCLIKFISKLGNILMLN